MNTIEITTEQLFAHLAESGESQKNLRIVDVRRADEYNNELGHIKGAELITLGPELTTFLEQTDRSQAIVFVCRSGVRSETATQESIKLGFRFTMNLIGGMIDWNEKKLPVVKS